MEFDKVKYIESLKRDQLIKLISFYEMNDKDFLTEEQKEYLKALKEIIKNTK